MNLTAQSAAVNPANPIGFVGTLNPPANKVGMQLQVYDAKKKKWVKKLHQKLQQMEHLISQLMHPEKLPNINIV